jgi:hypothetical protein
MPMECPDCGGRLTGADREADDYRCGRCGVLVREPRRTPGGDDYDDRPRRRRRPPKRSGRGVLLVLGAVGLLLLLGCGGVIGAVVWAGTPRWEEYRSPNGGYTVELPAKARADMAKIAANHGPVPPGVVYEGTLLLGRLEEYSIVYTDLAPDLRFGNTDEMILDQALKNLREGPVPATIISTKDVTVSGYKAREVKLRLKEQNLLSRIVVTPTRLYTAIAGGPFTGADEPRVRRFVESFKLNAERRDDDPAPAGDKWRQ